MISSNLLALLPLLAGLVAPVAAYPQYAKGNVIHVDSFGNGMLAPAHNGARGQKAAAGKKGVMLMNRIGPSGSTLYIANADGSGERALLRNVTTGVSADPFEYHASWSLDGKYISFTSERYADGNADIYRVPITTNGTEVAGGAMELIHATSSVEDAAVLSPDGKYAAFVSTANGYRTNIWVKDLATGEAKNLTNTATTAGNSSLPDGHFRPSWSHDSQWIAFSSDRNTPWRGHDNGTGWEHTQELSIYVIRPDGTDFRLIANRTQYSLGAPKFSPDDSRIVFHEMTRQDTWDAHRPEDISVAVSQIVSVDFATGLDRIEETSGAGQKMHPQYIDDTNIGYLIKNGASAGLNYTVPDATHTQYIGSDIRSPCWSPDGTQLVYERADWTIRAPEKPMYSWDEDWEYRFNDVFPELTPINATGEPRLALTAKQTGNATSDIVTCRPDGTDLQVIFNVFESNNSAITATTVAQGLTGAFQPAYSPDGQWIAFGLGAWFQSRDTASAWLYQVAANGSTFEMLTDGTINSGFPSYSHDGRYLVFRVWGYDSDGNAVRGLRVMDLVDRSAPVVVLTNDTEHYDNLPHFNPSPDSSRILFTRRTKAPACAEGEDTNITGCMDATIYDVCTINPDGTDLQVLTSDSLANDAHAVWTADGKSILFNTGRYGFRDECAIYDDTFQPYGQLMSMDADGSNKKMLTDSMWEDSMPIYLPNSVLV